MQINETEEETGENSINSAEPTAVAQLRDAVLACLDTDWRVRGVVVLCIGTDRATGDSLGPLVGYKLAAQAEIAAARDATGVSVSISVYGTLAMPVHAQNLCKTLAQIRATHPTALVIAVDACLGRCARVGWLTVARGSVRPGAMMQRSLPDVGDIFVMGTVNVGGAMDFLTLQNTRLHIVMHMAEIIADGVAAALGMPCRNGTH